MTPIEYVIAGAFAVAIGFALAEFQRENTLRAIWWGFACWILFGAGLVSVLLAQAERRSTEAKERELARTETDSAIAAQRESQRAWVTVTSVAFGPRAHLMDMPTAVVSLLNTGHRPASLTAHAVSITIDEDLPANPADFGFEFLTGGGVIARDKIVTIRTDFPSAFTPQSWHKLIAGRLKLIVCGVVRYETGVAGTEGETGFAFQYDHTAKYQPDTQRFNVYPAPGYNYSK